MSHAQDAAVPDLPTLNDVWQQTLNWQPMPAQQGQFQRLYELVLAANRELNLTRITTPEDFWEKHLWDSLSGIMGWSEVAKLAGAEPRVIDIGSGAGFPGVPLAIAYPQWSITLLEATRKKVGFQASLVQALRLERVQPEWGRAEELAKTEPGFDLALIRAVGPVERCAEYALPLLRPGGVAILYRGQWLDIETEQQQLQTILGRQANLTAVRTWLTPLSQNQRHCLYLQRC